MISMKHVDNSEYDAVVIGSGPNGLAAAIAMQQQGLNILILEAKDKLGGGTRTAELTSPGFHHDICSAIHPLAAGSPYLQQLPLQDFGLEYVQPSILAAHPLDSGEAGVLYHSLETTAQSMGIDSINYRKLFSPLVREWPSIANSILGPLRFPSNPLALTRFGLDAVLPSDFVAKRFSSTKMKALWSGMAAHGMMPLSKMTTSAIALVLIVNGHLKGWPIPKGGSQRIADSMAGYFIHLGGKIKTGHEVRSFDDLPSAKAFLFDTGPKQLLKIAGNRLSSWEQKQYKKFRYGMGVYKIDYALSEPVPFRNESCRQAGTVHIGNTAADIARAEHDTWKGKHPKYPFVLAAQPSLFDSSRAPEGKHTLWAYCHVPSGSTQNMTEAIENQIERFAPGFRDVVLARHEMNAQDMHSYNANYIGGDINGGVLDVTQLFTRPKMSLSPYRSSAKGVYICSSSTPPGGGVHGMCGFHAAKMALKDVFRIHIS